MNALLSCPLCAGNLELYIHDDTHSRFCDGDPCWDGGATCTQCGVGFSVGSFGSGMDVDTIEEFIIKALNARPKLVGGVE